MKRKAIRVAVALALALAPALLNAQAVADPEVVKGIKQVDDGEYDAAILTLDAAARRLAADASRSKELAQTYLYLGVAYLGKGHETSAKARFRDAIAQVKDLNLTPDKFAPRVIEVFEKAKEEAERAAPAPSKAAASPAPPPQGAAPAKKGGAGKGILIGVGIAAVGAGVAIAAKGGGSKSGSGQRQTENFSGNLGFNENLTFPITAASAGLLEATLRWTSTDAVLAMDLQIPGSIVATSSRSGSTSASLQANVGAQRYALQVLHRGDACVPSATRGASASACATAFTLTVVHP